MIYLEGLWGLVLVVVYNLDFNRGEAIDCKEIFGLG